MANVLKTGPDQLVQPVQPRILYLAKSGFSRKPDLSSTAKTSQNHKNRNYVGNQKLFLILFHNYVGNQKSYICFLLLLVKKYQKQNSYCIWNKCLLMHTNKVKWLFFLHVVFAYLLNHSSFPSVEWFILKFLSGRFLGIVLSMIFGVNDYWLSHCILAYIDVLFFFFSYNVVF